MDLDKTDQLPILEGVLFDPDVEDDAVRMEHAAAVELPGSAATGSSFARRPSICRCWPRACAPLNCASRARTPNMMR